MATFLERKPIRRAFAHWRARHREPFNFALHLIGIPLTVAGVVLFFFQPWYWAVGLFILGYVLQYLGHLYEGNDLGEWAAIKKLCGLPYVAIAPQWAGQGESIARDNPR